RLLGTMSKEGLAFYQKQYEPRAAGLLEAARQKSDVRQAAPVAQRYPYTRAGIEAAQFLAGYFSDRAQYKEAAMWIERLLLTAGIDTVPPDLLFKATVAFHVVQLRIGPVVLKEDPKTGFVVGGKNATALIKKLETINGIRIADLEKKMRPGNMSVAGFLGKDESL